MQILETMIPENEQFPVPAAAFPAGSCILHLESTGRFWRNSQITKLVLIRPGSRAVNDSALLPASFAAKDMTSVPASVSSDMTSALTLAGPGSTSALTLAGPGSTSVPASAGPADSASYREIPALKKSFLTEKEEDEYDLLSSLSGELRGGRLFTMNGTSFALPYLRRKLKAYGLADPFTQLEHTDLLREMKNIPLLLQLPSCRLEDFRGYFHLQDADDADIIFRILSLEPYLDFFRGKFELAGAEIEDGLLIYRLMLAEKVPKKASLHDGPFHVILSGKEAHLSAAIFDGRLRHYYADTENYEYLPEEGCAIHKSMASLVDRSRREKATRENCFTYVSAAFAENGDEKRLREYLSAVISYLCKPILPV